MKWIYEAAAFLILAVSGLSHRQQDVLSAFEKCRLVTPSDLTDRKAPTFETYRVPVPQVSGSPMLVLKSNPTARMYRTRQRQEVARGPNFAGHYRVAIWG